jgi:hypothetical protein
MKLAQPPTRAFVMALALMPTLALAHPGHPALPGHEHAVSFLQSPALGFAAGLAVVVILIAARAFPRRGRTTATRRR